VWGALFFDLDVLLLREEHRFIVAGRIRRPDRVITIIALDKDVASAGNLDSSAISRFTVIGLAFIG
jgi:hypothetical protein